MSVGSIPSIVRPPRAEPWKPAEVRERIELEHAELRELLVELVGLSDRLLTNEAATQLRLAVRAIVLLFGEHLHSEESVLVPALLRMEAWGRARAERLLEEHELQRALLRTTFHEIDLIDDRAELAAYARGFAERFLADIEEEDCELLPEVR